MTELAKPEYRVRLFLSVDLTGSTDFKSKRGQTSLDWLKAFQKFYGEFPSMFAERYCTICEGIPDIGNSEKCSEPKVWKTIGDEILFVNRVNSITQLGAFVSAFAETLKDFGSEIHTTHSLNTKGNGWVAAFPSPNCSIGLSRDGNDPLSGNSDLLTEKFESQVDENPHKFDFLGKGIDGGFRISRNSTIDTFTISPALAQLLCRAKRNDETTCFNCEFHFHEPQKLKGVVGGQYYPIVSIDTNRDQAQKDIHNLQAELLHQPSNAEFSVLAEYLEKYIDYHGIEKPALPLSHSGAAAKEPDHYIEYIKQWADEAGKLKAAEALELEAGENDGITKNGNAREALDDARISLNKLLELTRSATEMLENPNENPDADEPKV